MNNLKRLTNAITTAHLQSTNTLLSLHTRIQTILKNMHKKTLNNLFTIQNHTISNFILQSKNTHFLNNHSVIERNILEKINKMNSKVAINALTVKQRKKREILNYEIIYNLKNMIRKINYNLSFDGNVKNVCLSVERRFREMNRVLLRNEKRKEEIEERKEEIEKASKEIEKESKETKSKIFTNPSHSINSLNTKIQNTLLSLKSSTLTQKYILTDTFKNTILKTLSTGTPKNDKIYLKKLNQSKEFLLNLSKKKSKNKEEFIKTVVLIEIGTRYVEDVVRLREVCRMFDYMFQE